DEPSASVRVSLEDGREVAEELRHPVLEKVRCAALGFGLLLLVVEACGDRVVRIVNLGDEVRDRQLKLVGPEPSGLVARREPEPPAEKQQNVRRLTDQPTAGFQERRRERRALDVVPFEEAL